MKSRIIVIIVIVLISGVGALYFLNQQTQSSPIPLTPTGQSEQKVENVVSIDSNLAIGSDPKPSSKIHGGYVTGWGAEGYKNAQGDKIVLFFYANWCPTCRPVDVELKERNEEIPAGIEIYQVNYNDSDTDQAEKELAKKYGVTYQHTFIQIDKEGNEITRWNGGGLDKLLSSIK